MVLIVFGQLTNLILFCNTFYVTFLFPLETLRILIRGLISSGVDWASEGGGWADREEEGGQAPRSQQLRFLDRARWCPELQLGRQGGGWAPEEPWAVGGPWKYPTSPLGTFDGQTAALGGEAP